MAEVNIVISMSLYKRKQRGVNETKVLSNLVSFFLSRCWEFSTSLCKQRTKNELF